MHKKTTNWRILVGVVKWRHVTIVLLTQTSLDNEQSLFFLWSVEQNTRHANGHARDWWRETGEAQKKRSLRRSRARALLSLNVKKKRDCSQSKISPKRAIASYWWILVALSASFFCRHQNASQRHIGSQTFFLCFICLHIWITRVMLSNLKYRYRRELFTKRNEKKKVWCIFQHH